MAVSWIRFKLPKLRNERCWTRVYLNATLENVFQTFNSFFWKILKTIMLNMRIFKQERKNLAHKSSPANHACEFQRQYLYLESTLKAWKKSSLSFQYYNMIYPKCFTFNNNFIWISQMNILKCIFHLLSVSVIWLNKWIYNLECTRIYPEVNCIILC